ncbi:YbhB/YbcL family Raf kinase inhibitor-like protein [Chitinimonas naiadis]
MKLTSQSFADGSRIPGEFAFAVIDPASHVKLSTNRNPHLAWHDVPTGTQSFAIICHDVDVPSQGDDVNQEGREVPETLPRVDFFHWTLINLPADLREIAAGSYSNGVTARGKPGPEVAGDESGVLRQGKNDYTGWFAGDKDMAGDYYGYDGPCPPWNDSIVHRYVFTIYALDVPSLAVDDKLNGPAVWQALEGHVLDQATLTGHYTLNQRLAA